MKATARKVLPASARALWSLLREGLRDPLIDSDRDRCEALLRAGRGRHDLESMQRILRDHLDGAADAAVTETAGSAMLKRQRWTS